jgi:two-component system, chemotaxis family, chemotaxis protein CheY
MVAAFLDESGYEARTAADGREGLDVLATWRPDLVILDMMMPILDGRGFRAIQMGHDEWRRIPVIVLSATRAFLSQEETVGAGAVIAKPFDLDALLGLVEQWVGKEV